MNTSCTKLYRLLYISPRRRTDGNPFCSAYRPFSLYLTDCNCVQKCKEGRIWWKILSFQHKKNFKYMHIQDFSTCRSRRSGLGLCCKGRTVGTNASKIHFSDPRFSSFHSFLVQVHAYFSGRGNILAKEYWQYFAY